MIKKRPIEKIVEEKISRDKTLEGRAPRGYWKDFKNIEKELEEITKQLGHFPTSTELHNQGRSGLLSALTDYNGGLSTVRERMGYSHTEKPRGYWKDITNTINESERAMRELHVEVLPPLNVLNQNGYSSLSHAITAYFGGFPKFRRIIGQQLLRRENGELMSLENVKKEIKRIMRQRKLKNVPSRNQLIDYGESSIEHAITLYHGGFRIIRKEMGEDQRKVENGLWQNEKYVTKIARKIMRKFKKKQLPSSDILRKEGYTAFLYALHRYHGGIYQFRIKLGGKALRAKAGSWENLDYALMQAETAVHDLNLDRLPSHGILVKNKYGSLSRAIIKYHGGYPTFRTQLEQRMGGEPENKRLTSLLQNYAEGKLKE